MFILLMSSFVYAGLPDDGKVIFSARCAACHNINKVLTGPALAGVEQRRSLDWIINFVHSSQTVVKSGDPYAVALFQKFNKIQMPDHSDLTSDNIKSVVEYIKTQAVVSDTKAPFVKPTKLSTLYRPISPGKDYVAIIGYFIAVLLLIGTLLLAVHLRSLQNGHEKTPV